MKRLITFFLAFIMVCEVWSISKPMEAITNYNVLMVHGAYGSEKGFVASDTLKEAYEYGGMLGNGATLGGYGNNDRLTKWLSKKVFEEPDIGDERNAKNSYIYNWRSFSNPANSSHNNAYELGDRTWNKDGKFGGRRALVEEAQEVKAVIFNPNTDRNDSGQVALDSIRQKPDLYHQLASRYILVGHSMGGVVSREYVQGDFYNGDVDKIITLDSPHEGTGALNMQVKNEARSHSWSEVPLSLGEQAGKNFLKSIPTAAIIAIPFFCVKGFSPGIKAAILMLGATFAMQELSNPITRISAPEDFYSDDSLVHYVDPLQTGYGTIDSLNQLEYKEKVDSLPMIRIMASKDGLTFSDPALVDYGLFGWLNYLIPDNFMLPFANYGSQLNGSGDISTRNVNAFTSLIMGFGGIPVQDIGSSIVPASSSEGKNVGVLNDNGVDVRREYFNAALYASNWMGDLSTVLEFSVDGILLVDYGLGMLNPGFANGVKTALGIAAATIASTSMLSILVEGMLDMEGSHNSPIDENFKKWYKRGESAFVDSVHIYEDFLYEKPFVNLALSDSKTMDSLAKNPSAELNPSCFYGVDVDDEKQFCEIGLYGRKDSVVNVSFRKQNYKDFTASPLKFKSTSDWSKVGIKIDRWERVDGLDSKGNLAKNSVPIRHVERYEVPAITVENWIEKYSFVVDDLMTHRLRQIRMNFNYQEEIAWECDVTKDPEAGDACAVYKRMSGEEWKLADSIGNNGYVPHPVKKNGQFDFEPRKYGYDNLLAIQKDNQNTVTISTVNKIGLSNTQRFYYLFKATANKLDPVWPRRDIVLNKIQGFKAYASALGYQGFMVDAAKDSILRLSEDADKIYPLQDMMKSVDWYIDSARATLGGIATAVIGVEFV